MPHGPDFYDTDSAYLGKNEPNAVAGRRIANFFGVPDPYSEDTLDLTITQAAIRRLPELLGNPSFPIQGRDRETFAYSLLRDRAPALAEWLCGKTTRQAAKLTPVDTHVFNGWVYHDARRVIGTPAVYHALLEHTQEQ